ncbi:hypothetical protein [Actinoplanes sp. NPDC051851]|uniref:hypothetical protein n=1 Tax=Actinoplanes sp. NPDC051851 TaxID=3154753 RepID=UPI00343AD239
MVVAALVGAAAVVVIWRSHRAEDPAPSAGGTATASASASGPGAAAVLGCSGGADPAAAVQTAMTSPATPEGAAEAAAAVVRFTQSKEFGGAGAPAVIAKIADSSGAGQLVALQQGQAQYLNRMTVSAAHTGHGAFSVNPEPVSPTITVVAPVEWSTGSTQHLDWSFVDVRLLRDANRWTVISAQSTTTTPQGLESLRGADARQAGLEKFSGALAALGFRRYSGDC